VAVLFAMGCDDASSSRQPLSTGATVTRGPSEPAADAAAAEVEPAQAVTADAGAPAPGTDATLCRTYCETLEETDTYYCLGTGDTMTSCAARFEGLAAQCEQIRCPTGHVDLALCLTQCTSLNGDYKASCSGATPSPLCPSTPQAHDDACRAACSAASP
jgi:hypothetical protein